MVNTDVNPFERSVIKRCEMMEPEDFAEYGKQLTEQLAEHEFGSVEYSIVLTTIQLALMVYDGKTRKRIIRKRK